MTCLLLCIVALSRMRIERGPGYGVITGRRESQKNDTKSNRFIGPCLIRYVMSPHSAMAARVLKRKPRTKATFACARRPFLANLQLQGNLLASRQRLRRPELPVRTIRGALIGGGFVNKYQLRSIRTARADVPPICSSTSVVCLDGALRTPEFRRNRSVREPRTLDSRFLVYPILCNVRHTVASDTRLPHNLATAPSHMPLRRGAPVSLFDLVFDFVKLKPRVAFQPLFQRNGYRSVNQRRRSTTARGVVLRGPDVSPF